MNTEEARVRDDELYGIHDSNVPTVLTKNIFTTYLPIAASLYMMDNGIKQSYLKLGRSGLVIEEAAFDEIMATDAESLHTAVWNSSAKRASFDKSINPPGIDIIPVMNGEEFLEMEVKLTVVPTFNAEKVTEMIIRQNTQFCFAERLCYYHGSLFGRAVDKAGLIEFYKRNFNKQKPFIVHGLWKTTSGKELDKQNTLDAMIISDFAYLYILLNSQLEKQQGGRMLKTRIGRIVDNIIGWINEFKQRGILTYREPAQGSKDHLKITLYLVDYKPELKEKFYNLRLGFDDLLKIVPSSSIAALSPERRLDATLLFTLAKGQLKKSR
jgi:hypothetical protein